MIGSEWRPHNASFVSLVRLYGGAQLPLNYRSAERVETSKCKDKPGMSCRLSFLDFLNEWLLEHGEWRSCMQCTISQPPYVFWSLHPITCISIDSQVDNCTRSEPLFCV